MAITAKMVKELREKSGAGMMDCKKALVKHDGDMEASMTFLKEKGLAAAAKKSGRIASEGVVSAVIAEDLKKGVILELNCETDFTAKNDSFIKLSEDVTKHVLDTSKENGNVVALEESYDDSVKELVTKAVATIGENIKTRRYAKFEATEKGMVHSYIHMGGKIGVMVEIDSSDSSAVSKPELREMADDISMHVAAMNPACISIDDFPQDKLEAERSVFKTQVMEMGKPENIADKIVEGKVRKFVAENTLLEQVFVKNSDQKVKDFLTETGKKVGAELKIGRFIRFELGEGLEKKEENFAEEVAAQIK